MDDATSVFGWNHLLYRLFDADDALLYIGRTNNLHVRFAKHCAEQPWWHEVARSAIETRTSFEELDAAERAAIKTERPKYNITHNRPERPVSEVIRLRRPKRPTVKLTSLPDSRPVTVRPVDVVCARRGRLTLRGFAVHSLIGSYVDGDTYDSIDAAVDVETVARDSGMPLKALREAVEHLIRSGWLVRTLAGFRLTVPEHIHALGSDICGDGCEIHGGERAA